MTVKAEFCPENSTYSDIKWVAVNEKAVETNIVEVIPLANEDGQFCKLKANIG
jgi:hypothetical protein